jgi:integrase
MRGTIQRRRAGWKIQVYAGVDPITGRRRFLTKQINGSRAEAEHELAELVAEVAAGHHQAPAGATVALLMQRWLALADLEDSNRYQAGLRYRRHIEPALGAKKLRRLTALDLDLFYRRLEQTGLAASSVRRIHNDLSAAFAQAVRWQWLRVNPAASASPPAVPTRRPKAPSARQVRYLLDVALDASPTLAAFVRVAAATGARRGETCDLRWSDIAFAGDDLDDDGWGDDDDVQFGVIPPGGAAILIDSAVAERDGGIYTKGSKSGADNVPAIIVDAGTADALRAHRVRCVAAALLHGESLADDAFVFSRRPGGTRPWHPSSATHEFAKVRAVAVARIVGDAERDVAPDPAVPDRRRDAFAAAVAHVQLRQLRHFVATQLGAAGVPVATISGRLRHARTSTTLDFYSAALAAPDHQAATVLGKLLDGTG